MDLKPGLVDEGLVEPGLDVRPAPLLRQENLSGARGFKGGQRHPERGEEFGAEGAVRSEDDVNTTATTTTIGGTCT